MFAFYGRNSDSLKFNLVLYNWNIQALGPHKGDGVFEDVGKEVTCFEVFICDDANLDNDRMKWYYNETAYWISPREDAKFSTDG